MFSKVIRYAFLFLLIGILMSYDMPKGWVKCGTNPRKYEMGTDIGAGQDGKNAATIRAVGRDVNGSGSLIQRLSTDNYKGKRIRLSGFLKTKKVYQWAGLVLKVLGRQVNPFTGKEQNKVICFDNMCNRPVSGTTEFTKYEIVLDVPDTASEIVFGGRLTGSGQIWFDQLKLDIVGSDVPVTTLGRKEPTNLNFDE